MMKKAVLVLLTLLLAVMGGISSATSVADLSSLAAYYPANTAMFATIRTDDAYIEAIDTLYQDIQDLMPLEARRSLPPALAPLLDLGVQSIIGANFEDGVRSWLGDSIAIGAQLEISMMTGQDFPFLVAVEITDKAAAVTTLERLTDLGGGDDMVQMEEGEFTVFVSNQESGTNPVIAVGDEVLFFSVSQRFIPFEGVRDSLADEADFADTAAMLPGDDYNALVYINNAAVQEFNMNTMAMTGQVMPPEFARLAQAAGSQVWGLSFDENKTFMIDIAIGEADLSIYDELGIETAVPGAVDLSFASHIPADAAFVVHSSDFGPTTTLALDNLRTVGDYLRDNGGFTGLFGDMFRQMDMRMSREEMAIIDTLLTPETFMSLTNISFSGLTGLSLERDVLPVLDGDFAVYLRALPARNLPSLPAYPDAALLFQSSDSEGAKTMMDALIEAAEAYDTGYAVEAYGEDGAALVFPLVGELLRFEYKPFDILVAQDADVFAIGSRAAVEAAVSGDASLADDATFQTAGAYLLDGAQQVWYVNVDSFGVLIDEIVASGNMPPRDVRDMVELRYVLSLLDHATLSATTGKNGTAVMRMTFTIAEDPVLPPNPEDA